MYVALLTGKSSAEIVPNHHFESAIFITKTFIDFSGRRASIGLHRIYGVYSLPGTQSFGVNVQFSGLVTIKDQGEASSLILVEV